jgi:hypothetical protein
VYIKGTFPSFLSSFLFSLVSSNSAVYEADYSCISYVPSQQLSILVANIIVFEHNLSVVKEKESKDKSIRAFIKNKQCLVIYYALNVNLNILVGSIKRLSFP